MDGLPMSNYFELCAVYLLEYENILKENKIRDKNLKELVRGEDNDYKENNIQVEKIAQKKSIKKERDIKGKMKKVKINQQIHQQIKLKTKDYAISKFNIEIEKRDMIDNNEDKLIPPKIELNLIKERSDATSKENEDKINLTEYFDKQDQELIQLNSTPQPVSYVNFPLESFDLEVDIVNHITESGGLDNLKININSKNNLSNHKEKNENESESIKNQINIMSPNAELQNELKSIFLI